MNQIVIFKSGTHNNKQFTNDDVVGIFSKIKDVPIVSDFVGDMHPESNEYPTIGKAPKKAFGVRYNEKGEAEIVLDKSACDYSKQALNMLKNKRIDKPSIRIINGDIAHIALVKVPAVVGVDDFSFPSSSFVDFAEPDIKIEKESDTASFASDVYNIIIGMQEMNIDEKVIKKLKEFYLEFFGAPTNFLKEKVGGKKIDVMEFAKDVINVGLDLKEFQSDEKVIDKARRFFIEIYDSRNDFSKLAPSFIDFCKIINDFVRNIESVNEEKIKKLESDLKIQDYNSKGHVAVSNGVEKDDALASLLKKQIGGFGK